MSSNTSDRNLAGRASIAGIGATDFSKDSGRSELRLAAEAVTSALDDAGLSPGDVDGLVSFTMDTNTEIAVARASGIGELKFFSRIHYGGGAAAATVQQAAMAVATGVAEVVVCYRAFNERSGMRFGQVNSSLVGQVNSSGTDNAFSYPHGLSTPAGFVAMVAQRYMHCQAGRRSSGSAPPTSPRIPAAPSCAWLPRPCRPPWPMPGSIPRMWTAWCRSPWTPTPRSPSPAPPVSAT